MPYPPQGAANNVDVELADSQTINGDAVRHGDSEGSSVATPSGFVSFSAPDPTCKDRVAYLTLARTDSVQSDHLNGTSGAEYV